MRVLLTGARGQLATDLAKVLVDEDLIALSHGQLDIASRPRVDLAIGTHNPDVVINTAAFHRVDDCEREIEKAFEVNVYGARNIALACKESSAALLHVSTDYVFDGAKRTPYLEDDAARPISIYGISKVAGELVVASTLERHYIVRSSGLYGAAGASGKGGNFVNTMLRLAREGRTIKVVDDQRLTPTYTPDLARKIAWLIKSESYGVWHVTNGGDCTWYEFAAKIFETAGLNPPLSPTTTADFRAPAKRPANSVLAHGMLQRHQADDLPAWTEALEAYLREIGVV